MVFMGGLLILIDTFPVCTSMTITFDVDILRSIIQLNPLARVGSVLGAAGLGLALLGYWCGVGKSEFQPDRATPPYEQV